MLLLARELTAAARQLAVVRKGLDLVAEMGERLAPSRLTRTLGETVGGKRHSERSRLMKPLCAPRACRLVSGRSGVRVPSSALGKDLLSAGLLRGMKAARELAKIGLNRSETVRGPSRTVRETVREITGGYRHERPASDQAAAFTRAFESSPESPGSANATGVLKAEPPALSAGAEGCRPWRARPSRPDCGLSENGRPPASQSA